MVLVLDLVSPPTKVNNLIFGRTWVDSPGEMVMTNLTTGDKVVLYFQPCGWFGYLISLLNLILTNSDLIYTFFSHFIEANPVFFPFETLLYDCVIIYNLPKCMFVLTT